MEDMYMRSLEICAGGGGQALGLEQAGFGHAALVEIDGDACRTLSENRPEWNVICGDARNFSAKAYYGIDLLAGGVPCPPFSVAGKQLGAEDERDLFPEALRLAGECMPRAVMIENVRGLLSPRFEAYRRKIQAELEGMGYTCWWRLVQASHFGVSQSRFRALLVAVERESASAFAWPVGTAAPPPTVGQLLLPEMASNGWEGAEAWAQKADGIAPTLVGGSKRHGGPDLGPARAREAWLRLGVDGRGIADSPPQKGYAGMPRLTVKMAALVQGFPPGWVFAGKKTAAYRQVGNAFPPPVAKAVGMSIYEALAQSRAPGRKEAAV
jgi:DNA (cytosine-5)-methyltransferase 1